MGTPDFAVPILKAIFESKHNVLEVYTQPPKKMYRGQKLIFHQFTSIAWIIKLK